MYIIDASSAAGNLKHHLFIFIGRMIKPELNYKQEVTIKSIMAAGGLSTVRDGTNEL